MIQKILIIGPAHPLRGGGITTFNHRLAKEFIQQGYDCSIVSFSLQYPAFLFPGKSQYSDQPPPENLTIHTLINSVNPLNWINVGKKIRNWKPDLVIGAIAIPIKPKKRIKVFPVVLGFDDIVIDCAYPVAFCSS